MPDRNTPNWTPDDTFWNEGWADMDRRLTKKRRRPLFLFLLLFGCITLSGTLALYMPEMRDASGTQPTGEQRTESVKEKRIAAAPPVREWKPSTLPEPAKSPRANRLPTTAPAPPAPRFEAIEVETYAYLEVQVVQPLETAVHFLPTDQGPPALLPRVPPVDTAAEASSFISASGTSGWVLSIGANAYAGSFLPGGSAAVEYRWGQGTWYFPLSLRYDHSRRKLHFGSTSELEDAIPQNPPGGVANGFSGSTFRSQVESSSLNRVTTHSLELRAGAGRSVSDRFRISGGLGLSYLLNGRGPVIVSYIDSTYYGLTVQRDQLASGNAYADRAVGGSGSALNTSVNRFGATGWVGADYRIGKSWAAGVGITRCFTTFYREDVLDIERTRFEIRITKAW